MRAKERDRALCSGTILKNILRILNIVQDTYLTTDVVSNKANMKAVNANVKQLCKGDFSGFSEM